MTAWDITDGVRVLNYLFLGTAELPLPHPTAGPDATPDALSCLGF